MLDDLRAIDRLAGVCAKRSFSRTLPLPERHEAARGAIVLALAEAADTLTVSDIIAAGTRGIDAETAQWRRDNGMSAPVGWATYWLDLPVPRTPDGEVPPRLALREVFDALPERHQESLLVLAVHGDPQAAARHLGISYSTMQHRIRAARTAALALWFDWESSPRPTFDRRSTVSLADACGQGHEFTPENTRWRKATSGRGRKRACRECDRLHDAARKGRARDLMSCVVEALGGDQ